MADRTAIEWCDATWNPVRGCTRVSEGCRHCYAERMAARFNKRGQWGDQLAVFARRPDGTSEARWTGTVSFDPTVLDQPIRWYKRRRIFVCSTSDLFHESVAWDWIAAVWRVMRAAPQHTFQVLTKRPERARDWINWAADDFADIFADIFHILLPLPNVWLGVSAEDQATAEARIPLLLQTPAARRFLSAEPMLGPIDLGPVTGGQRLDWVICGGESGPGARPMHPDWARGLRDQCRAAGVPFFFKQWGEWGPDAGPPPEGRDRIMEGAVPCAWWDGGRWRFAADLCASAVHGTWRYRLGKKAAGRALDGREWSEMPR
jgi:protein gp37